MKHEEIGERGSGYLAGKATKEGVTLRMYPDEEGRAYCDLLPDAALRLGEWLIAQAIAQGAERGAGSKPRRWHIVDGRKVSVEWEDEEGLYLATVPSLPGCSAVGASEPGASREAGTAIRAWIEACKVAGNAVPAADWSP